MDIKTKKRTNNSIELTFSDISTKTTIPLSLSDALQLQAGIARTVNECYKSSPAKMSYEDIYTEFIRNKIPVKKDLDMEEEISIPAGEEDKLWKSYY